MHLAPDDIAIRPLEHWDELEAAVVLQQEIWGADFDDIVSAALMRVCQKVGGVAAGAFDGGGALVGVVFGLAGVRHGRPAHWSHMLAVRADWQGRGLGRRMKVYQREVVRALGVEQMYWTYEPLEARNAHFNLNRLGASVAQYARDLYGSGATSPLHSGVGTDRFVVVWPLEEARVARALAGTPPALPAEAAQAPALGPAHAGTAWPDARRVRVEIPADLQALKASAPEEARRWRQATRGAFEHYLGRGYQVAGFYRDPVTSRCYYVLAA